MISKTNPFKILHYTSSSADTQGQPLDTYTMHIHVCIFFFKEIPIWVIESSEDNE